MSSFCHLADGNGMRATNIKKGAQRRIASVIDDE
jgi:hypothetical protein